MPSTDPRRPRPGRRRQREIRELQRTSTLSWSEAAAQVDLEHDATARGLDVARAQLTIVEPPITGDDLASWRTSQASVLITVEDPRQPEPIKVRLVGSTPAREELDRLNGWPEVYLALDEHGWTPRDGEPRDRKLDVFAVERNAQGHADDEWTRIIISAGLPADERAAQGYILAVHEALNQHGFRTHARGMPHDGITGGIRSASMWLELPPGVIGNSTSIRLDATDESASIEGLYWNEMRGWGFGPLSEPLQGLSRLAPPQEVVAAVAHATGLPVPVPDDTCWTPPPGYIADAEIFRPAQAAAYAAYAQFYLDHEATTREA